MDNKKLLENIKLMAFDIDGTLLQHGQLEFNNEIIDMFKKLKQNNIKTIIATAREFVTIGKLLNKANMVDYFVGANGAFVYSLAQNKIIYERTIKFDDFKFLYEFFINYKPCDSFMLTDNNYGFKSPNMDTNTWFLRPHTEKLIEMDYEKINKEHIHIITIGCKSAEDSQKCSDMAKKIINENNLDLEITAKWSKGVFIAKKGTTKSHTLQWLCDYLGYKQSDNMMAFGDSSNDYEMLRDSAYGVSMQRANDWVKSVANDIAIDCEHNGVKEKIKELGFIN
ncbi:HAD family phosphatase [Mycoplasma tauri]|uniref:YcsE-related riboflavin metabolism phosphatase n=1 Tax=Mycoplasma tauri TaxID=547987 RepID=UPI001966D903|nr:HAD family hydrolase [Mycoplasma tauri]QSB07561.1 HAD family phosphatase [Mycoplasma tauri]